MRTTVSTSLGSSKRSRWDEGLLPHEVPKTPKQVTGILEKSKKDHGEGYLCLKISSQTGAMERRAYLRTLSPEELCNLYNELTKSERYSDLLLKPILDILEEKNIGYRNVLYSKVSSDSISHYNAVLGQSVKSIPDREIYHIQLI